MHSCSDLRAAALHVMLLLARWLKHRIGAVSPNHALAHAFAMASVMEASPSNTCSPVTIRREDFVNQFRVAVVDECGRHVEWRVQVGEPVFYSDDGISGYSYIKSISAAGFFTVNARPTVKNECSLAQKYIDKIPLDKIRELVSTGAVPPPETFKWEKWAVKTRKSLQRNSGFDV